MKFMNRNKISMDNLLLILLLFCVVGILASIVANLMIIYKEISTTKSENFKISNQLEIKEGYEIGTLSINAININNENIYYGTRKKILKKGICMARSDEFFDMPKKNKITMLACHNYLSFKNLNRIKEKDQIDIMLNNNKKYKYEVYSSSFVKANDYEKVCHKANKNDLMLITCHPYIKGTNDNWIVLAKLI